MMVDNIFAKLKQTISMIANVIKLTENMRVIVLIHHKALPDIVYTSFILSMLLEEHNLSNKVNFRQ